ncbi:hypothetical protein FXW78_23975 [Rhodococcus opacus]|nr:hypothetical protein [Rhodococcus opacus]
MTLGALPTALLRTNYRLVRILLQLVEDLAQCHLDEQAPSRLAYEQLLLHCDRTAAHLLHDEDAARRAADLTRHTAAVRLLLAREQCRIRRRGLIVLDEQRARFEHRRRDHPRGPNPDPA